jgi:hypothetical protein
VLQSQRVFDVSAATASQVSRVFSNPKGAGLLLRLDVTVGTTLDLQVQIDAVWPNGVTSPVLIAPAAGLTGTGTTLFWVSHQGFTSPAPVSQVDETIAGTPMPERYRITLVHGNANPATYTLDAMPDLRPSG